MSASRITGVGYGRRIGFSNTGSARRGGAPAYDPSSEAGYVYDVCASAADVTAVDDAGTPRVSAWTERVSGVPYTNATVASRPVWLPSEPSLGGRPAVHFPGTARLDAAIGLGATSHTIYCFGTMEATTAAYRVLVRFRNGVSPSLYAYQTTNTGAVGFLDGAVKSFSAGSATTGAQALVWSLVRGGTAEGWRGVVPLGTAACAAFSASTESTLGDNPSFNHFANAKIGRLLIFSGIHDSAARSRVLAWGSDYYGISL